MRYLIDGHNLIAHMPDIDLDDENDEAKLVFKLRSFCARTNKRITVVFDGGLPGGISNTLSNSRVTVKFASYDNSTADQILIGMLHKIKNTREYTLVSSDRELRDMAQHYDIEAITSPQFMDILSTATPSNGTANSSPNEDDDNDKDDNPYVSPEEVEEWLTIFTTPHKKKPKRKRL